MTTANEVRHGTLLWPYHLRANVHDIVAAATTQAEGAAADGEWIGNVQIGTMRPAPGLEGTLAVPYSYQVVPKGWPGASIAARAF